MKVNVFTLVMMHEELFCDKNCLNWDTDVTYRGDILFAGEGLPHTAGTHLMSGESGDAVFVLGQTGGALQVVKMTDVPYTVCTETIKNASLMNRLFTGFVPGMFRLVLYQNHSYCMTVRYMKCDPK